VLDEAGFKSLLEMGKAKLGAMNLLSEVTRELPAPPHFWSLWIWCFVITSLLNTSN
jgi:hypothetical protein